MQMRNACTRFVPPPWPSPPRGGDRKIQELFARGILMVSLRAGRGFCHGVYSGSDRMSAWLPLAAMHLALALGDGAAM